MNNEPQKSIQETVLAEIEAGHVTMRPRWQFLLRAGLLVIGVVLVALTILFLGSFIIFILRQNGAWFAIPFGGPGIKDLLLALPVVFIVVAIVFLVLLQLLVSRYSFSYARPVLYSVVGIAGFVALGSFIITQTGFHEGLFEQARDRHLPIIGGFYRQFGEAEADHIIPGLIIEKTDQGFNMNDPKDQKFIVIITPETQLPYDTEFAVGDNVIVLGDKDENIITADGIRKIEKRPRGNKEHGQLEDR